VEDIPNELRSDKALQDYFEQLFPNRVHSTCLVLHVPDLQELCDRRDRVLRRLEKCQAILEIAGKRPHHKVGSHKLLDVRVSRKVDLYDSDPRLPQNGERVDSINYYTKYLQILNERVAEGQQDKMRLAQKGDTSRRASEWITHSLGITGNSQSEAVTNSVSDLVLLNVHLCDSCVLQRVLILLIPLMLYRSTERVLSFRPPAQSILATACAF
jgi:hypothetical protein